MAEGTTLLTWQASNSFESSNLSLSAIQLRPSTPKLQPTDLNMSQTPKEVACSFLQLVSRNHVDEAYAQYVDMSGKHHNMYTPAGFAALKQAMKDSHAAAPNTDLRPHTILCDGNVVAVHSLLLRVSGPNISVVHIFRIEHGRIVEMWDCGAPVPEDCLNTDGPF